MAAPRNPPQDDVVRARFGSIADAIGQSFLVFAFLPPLAALPAWLELEAFNALNRQDLIVLAFLPARGLLILLDAFSAGLAQRALAGVLTGAVLSALLSRRRPFSRPRRAATGAVGGIVGATLSLLVLPLLPGDVASHSGAPLLDLVSGALCGLVAAPGAHRALAGSDVPDPPLVAAAR